MDNIKIIIRSGLKFYKQLKKEKNGRYRSWEYCYSNFYKAHKTLNIDDNQIDYLCLHLSFYLASWGMYRGSSFLLQKDYKVHRLAIREILKPEYSSLWGISPIEYLRKENQEKLVNITEKLKEIYSKIKQTIPDFNAVDRISDTLITKILMGTFGCTPAYDRYFISGIRINKVASGNYNLKSIIELSNFYEKYHCDFEKARKQLKIGNLCYPPMKFLDSCFWQVGFDLDNDKGMEKAY